MSVDGMRMLLYSGNSMKQNKAKRVLLAVLFFTASVGMVEAAEIRGFGLGVLLGEPTGLSAKAWLGDVSAVDGAAAWSFQGEDSFYFHSDYLLHYADWPVSDAGILSGFAGIGGKLHLEEDLRLGLRIPFGLSYSFDSVPVELFIEFAPGVDLIPATQGAFTGGLGVRYYFGG
jgi:hypothetical protein